MRVLALSAFVCALALSAGASAQEQSGASAREVQKAACQRDARLAYRTGNSMASDLREKMMEARKTYVQQCLERSRPTTG
jgi:basic membrane lipoprotein Med (substrate-binding protein (PBP1-ABC) superfamily)